MTQIPEILVSLKIENGGTLAEMTVRAGVERVWHVLTSFEEMPAHLSGLRRSRIVKNEGPYKVVEQTARMGIPLLPLSLRVVLEVVEDRPFLYFKERNGSSTPFRGYWRVDRSSNGTGSRVCYYLEASLGQGLRQKAVEQHLHRMIRQNMQELAVWIDRPGT